MSTINQTIGVIYWTKNQGSFDWYYFKLGIFGSTFQIMGGMCLNLAIATGKALGPSIAIVSCQMILLSIASSKI
jgi:hypothetical protein